MLLFSALVLSVLSGPAQASTSQRLSHDYDQAVAELKALAGKAPGAQTTAHSIRYPALPSLTVDTVYLPPTGRHRKNLIVLISGQHGVEAPAGSAIQRDYLEGCGIDRAQTGVLIIHAMNPYGFKYGRRFNHNNVDLNRNSFDALSESGERFPGKKMHNAVYDELSPILKRPTTTYFHELVSLPAVLKSILSSEKGIVGGVFDILEAFGGQYQDPSGPYFGGSDVQPETALVQKLLSEKVPSFENVLLLNIHTGIGKFGINNLMFTRPAENSPAEIQNAFQREIAELKRLFPDGSCEGACGYYRDPDTKPGIFDRYSLPGTLTQWIYGKFEAQRKRSLILPVVVEIGTFSGPIMLPKVLNENYCFTNPGSCNDYWTSLRIRKLREAFSPSDQRWQRAVQKISVGVCTATKRFTEN